MAELGFVRNESARQLRAGRSRTLGLVVLDVANPFFTDVAEGVEERRRREPLRFSLQQRQARRPRARYLDLLEEQRVHGRPAHPGRPRAPVGSTSCAAAASRS